MGNPNTVIRGDKVLLVPYRPEHVPKYHQWMQNPELLEATASEPLSLEAEYDMQRTWVADPEKCTFILLDPEISNELAGFHFDGAMAGDINLFWSQNDPACTAEVSVMVAEKRSRRKGIAEEAVRLVMTYGAQYLGRRVFCAKIGMDNTASLNLFQNKLGFIETCRSDIFKEITLQFTADEKYQSQHMTLEKYET